MSREDFTPLSDEEIRELVIDAPHVGLLPARTQSRLIATAVELSRLRQPHNLTSTELLLRVKRRIDPALWPAADQILAVAAQLLPYLGKPDPIACGDESDEGTD